MWVGFRLDCKLIEIGWIGSTGRHRNTIPCNYSNAKKIKEFGTWKICGKHDLFTILCYTFRYWDAVFIPGFFIFQMHLVGR